MQTTAKTRAMQAGQTGDDAVSGVYVVIELSDLELRYLVAVASRHGLEGPEQGAEHLLRTMDCGRLSATAEGIITKIKAATLREIIPMASRPRMAA